jgi:hypothetical protein
VVSRGEIREVFRDIGRADTAFVRSGVAEPTWRLPGKYSDREQYAKLVSGAGWSDLEAYAGRLTGQADLRLASLRKMQTRITAAMLSLDESRTAAGQLPESVADTEHWSKIRDELVKQYGGTVAKRHNVEVTLDRLESLSPRRMVSDRRRMLTMRAGDLDATARRLLAAEAGAEFARLVAKLNRVHRSRRPKSFDRRALKRTLSNEILGLQADVAQGDWDAVATRTDGMADVARGTASKAADWLNSSSRRGFGLAESDLIRRSFEVLGVALWASWIAGWQGTTTASRWTNAAGTLAKTGSRTWPDGRDVRGIVTDLAIVHRARKVVSTMTVQTAGPTKKVAVPYIKLDSTGIVPGAEVIARCSPARRFEWHPNGPVHELLRFRLTENAKTKWADWLIAQSHDVFNAWPNGIAASWSLTTGPDGAGNPLRYGVWTDHGAFERRIYGFV